MDRARGSRGLEAGRRGAGVATARDLRSPRRPDRVLPGGPRAPRAVRRSRARGAEDRRGGACAARRILARGRRARGAAAIAPPRAARRRHLRGRAAGRHRAAAAGAAAHIHDVAREQIDRREALFHGGVLGAVPAAVPARRGALRWSSRRIHQPVDHGNPGRAVGGPHALRFEGAARAELRQSHRRAQRDGATFEVVPPEGIEPLLPALQRISTTWLASKSTGEKRFSMGAFSAQYLRQFPLAVVRCGGAPAAFTNLWTTGTRAELSVDLMRFGPEAPRSAMDYLFVELMLWGRAAGYRSFNLGMAPLSGLEAHPLAPAWHRVGNFIFRHGEHFYNFEGLRRYKAKFAPSWEPRYLVARGGIALPRVLVDVSVLIAGGMKELFAR
ncbi:MAG: DUF2156 domain-containing protein [Gammaproteobacteria bacterium]|nr:MAG: DUF2156 domain-containing protein [Gammaproteobacteria bacterium]